MGYTHTITVPLAWDEAVQQTREALSGQGFGILSEINVRATFEAKLGPDAAASLGEYVILGACNPSLASRALAAEPDLGALLPCNVVVRRAPDADQTTIQAIDPWCSSLASLLSRRWRTTPTRGSARPSPAFVASPVRRAERKGMTGGGSPGADPAEQGPEELQHPRFARAYARGIEGVNRRGGTEHRRELLAGLHGFVIEIGAGDGSGFSLYPQSVARVLALEPDDYLRNIAAAKAASAPVPVEVRAGTAEHIPAGDASVDAVVASLVLCSVSEQAPVLAEIRRVLRPGGILAFYEHVRSGNRVLATVEDVLTPAWQRLAGGCHPNRNTVAAIEEAGFSKVASRRFNFAVHPLSPAVAHVLGTAVSPGRPVPR